MCHVYSHTVGSWSLYGICIHQPSLLLAFSAAFSQAHWFYHGTHLTSEPWDPYESGIMFTVTQRTCSYAMALDSFALAVTLAFAHISLAAGHILCSLVLLNPLHGMQMLCFYFSIIFFIRLVHIISIYSASCFGFGFILFDAGFIYLTYLVVLSLHICLGPLYTLQ